MVRLTRVPAIAAVLLVPVLGAVTLALATTGSAQARTQYPYTLVDPGTFGGPQSFLNVPGIPLTKDGMLLGTADTAVPDTDSTNPFIVGFPDAHVVHAFSWRNGQLTDLGALPGDNSSAVFDVNGNGVGVGMSETPVTDPYTGWPSDNAVMFKDGKVINLGTLPGGYESQAQDINDKGQVSGFASNGTPDQFSFFGWGTQVRSFIWQNGVIRDIGTLGGADALMNAANERGQITGQSYTNSTPNPSTGIPTIDPFLWTNGRMQDLGTLGGTIGNATWLNAKGEVVGFSDLAGDQTAHPFLWDGTRMIDLGTLGGSFGQATWINGAGDVVGQATLPGDSTAHAVLWKHGETIDLSGATNPECTYPTALNALDQAVGNTCHEDNALLWVGGVQHDLNTLIPPSPLKLVTANYINDQGDIVGHGVLPDGSQRVYLLIPNQGVPLPLASTAAARSSHNRLWRTHQRSLKISALLDGQPCRSRVCRVLIRRYAAR
jgi:probable HAF family extracellular repeat protein